MNELVDLLLCKQLMLPSFMVCSACSITITTKGKYTAINGGAIAPLVSLVDDEISEVRLNALKVQFRSQL